MFLDKSGKEKSHKINFWTNKNVKTRNKPKELNKILRSVDPNTI